MEEKSADSASRQGHCSCYPVPSAYNTFGDLSNTAKLSSLTLQRTISFQVDTKPAPENLASEYKMSSGKTGRRRRSSSIIYHEPPESLEHISDQSALPNLNSQWVNAKGEIVPIAKSGRKGTIS
jgi:hypothetical protein